MRIDLDPPGGGVTLEGDTDELEAFAGDVLFAAANGVARSHVITDTAVENFVIRRTDAGDGSPTD